MIPKGFVDIIVDRTSVAAPGKQSGNIAVKQLESASHVNVGIPGPAGPPGLPGELSTGADITKVVDFSVGHARTFLCKIPSGCRISRVEIRYTEAFNDPYTSVSIGTDADMEYALRAEDNRPTFVAEFDDTSTKIVSIESDFFVFVQTSGSSGAGSASITYSKE